MQSKQQAEGRYRGSRRLPQLPRSRYAAVITTAIVGASVVALAAGAALPDSGGPGRFPFGEPEKQMLSIDDRLNAADKATRSEDRSGPAISAGQGAPDVWLLPLRSPYQITTRYEMRWSEFHYGIDMSAPFGTPIYATHAGTVVLSRAEGGYGLCVQLDNGNGILAIYGHASRLIVKEGQRVDAGQLLALVGSTGFSTGDHLHYEIHINGVPTNPFTFMRARGVDFDTRAEAASGGIVVS